MCRFSLSWFIHFAILLTATSAISKEKNLLETLNEKHSVISGVLNPGSVSFNGREIYNGKENFSALLINNVPVKINSVSGLQTFYQTTLETSLELEWQTLDGKVRPLLKIENPAVTAFKTDGDKLYLRFTDSVSAAKLDSKDIDLKEPQLRLDNFKNWMSETHSLELFSKNNNGQIYNLDFKNIRSDLLTSKSLSLATSDGPFSGNIKPQSVGMSIRILDEKSFSYDFGIFLSRVDYEMGSGNAVNRVTQSAGELKFHFGYNPFDANSGGLNIRRLTLGVQTDLINYRRKSDFSAPYLDGINSAEGDFWFLQGGAFFRWEPLQYKDVGFFITLEFRNFRTSTMVTNDEMVKTIGLTYYYF